MTIIKGVIMIIKAVLQQTDCDKERIQVINLRLERMKETGKSLPFINTFAIKISFFDRDPCLSDFLISVISCHFDS